MTTEYKMWLKNFSYEQYVDYSKEIGEVPMHEKHYIGLCRHYSNLARTEVRNVVEELVKI